MTNCDLVLLLWSEMEIDAGLSLLGEAHLSSGYHSAILVVSQSPKPLINQIQTRLEKAHGYLADSCRVQAVDPDAAAIVNLLKDNAELRTVMMPGLDQLRDMQRQLLRDIDVTVICYQTHEGIGGPSPGAVQVSPDPRGTITAFRTMLGVPGRLRHRSIDALLESPSTATDEWPTGDSAPASSQDAESWYYLATDVASLDSDLKKSRQLMDSVLGPVFLVRAEKGWSRRAMRSRWLRQIVKVIPQMDREQRKALSEQLERESVPSFDFLALICASSFLAAFGLAQNSAAVIIGAMLVAPLMSPILAAGLALAQGNRVLFTRSLQTVGLGFVAALSAGALFGMLLQLVPNSILARTDQGLVLTTEMWSRTDPGSLDFLVGLVGGSAAAFARTRKELSSALAGAAIAAALVPPIATAGMELALLGQTIQPQTDHSISNLVLGPSLLFLCNMLTIIIGSSFVLWASGTRGVHDHSSKERWTVRMMAILATFTVLVFVWIVQHRGAV